MSGQPEPTQTQNPSKQQNQKKKKADKAAALSLKTPKGTRDYGPEQMAIREKAFHTITKCFKRHGAVTIETPVFELKELLTNKYGEESKLIYDLQDQGGEICSLRYDLTVPFSRYVAMNRIKSIKRYQIARVYRRDNPVMTKGRFREFYQCDFDIAGNYDLMIPDAECLKLITEILDEVQIGSYMIKLNHRKLLDGIFELSGVPDSLFRPISSSIDKLDKAEWEEVRKEMVEEKKLDSTVADKIHTFVLLKGNPHELLQKIRSENLCAGNSLAEQAIKELEMLFEYTDCYGITDKISFDLSLARGLDYYTGLIYEAVLTDTHQVGSIAAGGRYDELVGSLGGEKIPAVGFSVGIERLFNILEEKAKKEGKLRSSETQVIVASLGKGTLSHRMKICSLLWKHNINAELYSMANPNFKSQLNYANSIGANWVILFGDDELKQNVVQLKNMKTSEQTTIPVDELIPMLLTKLKAE